MSISGHWNKLKPDEKLTTVLTLIVMISLVVWWMGKSLSAIRVYGASWGSSVNGVESVGKSNNTEGVLPLEKMMPKFEIVTNADNTYQIRFMAYNSTNWSLCEPVFSNEMAAASVIAVAEIELEVKYRVMKGLADDLRGLAEGKK
jgi:hypothetical protein